MRANILLAAALLSVGGAGAQRQGPAGGGRLDALHDLSASLEGLSLRVGRAVVQVFSTSYALTGEEGEANGTDTLSKQHSTGSGVVLSADGYVVTNYHVVQAARRIHVRLNPESNGTRRSILAANGKTLNAKVVGVDRESDLAVLKLEEDQTEFPFLKLGDSNALRQGQLVMAFGNPMGLSNSVSLGVVSSVARQLRQEDPMIYIQTDAPINPGNSGGPLVDADGTVMGINTMILSQSGGSEGIGFAVPSNIVANVYEQIRKSGHVRRGQIGARVQTITPVMASGLSLPQEWGVLMADVDTDGPAEQAGLEVGDIVLTMNGKTMENARQFSVNLYRAPVGSTVTLEIQRKGQKLTVPVQVIERNDDPLRFADMVDPERNLIPKLGILGIQIDRKIGEMFPELRNPYGIVVGAKTEEPTNTPNGLQPGDVIYSINGLPTATIEALRNAVMNLKPGSAVVLQVERDGRLMFMPFEME